MPPRFPPIATLLTTILLISTLARAQSDPQRVADQFREYCLAEFTSHGERLLDDIDLPKTSISSAMGLIAEIRPDGSWADIDYASSDRSVWPPFTQLTRTLSIVVRARRSETSPADAAQCFAAAHHALGFWIEHDYQCPNWWFNTIGVPKTLGHIALLLDNDLTPKERSYILDTAMARSKVGTMTGQNREWLAGIGIMRAAMLNDDKLLITAANVIKGEIRLATDEGLQPDWSFHQHGPQQQFGNYGLAFATEMSRWATVLRNTHYAITGEQLELLRNYLLQGQSWIAWRGAMDISSCGRQLSPNSPRSKAAAIASAMRIMSTVDPAKSADYLAYVTRNQHDAPNDLVGNRYFYRSDYLIHRRPNWMTTLKMSSDRVIGGETVNSENLSGLHLADGATFFYLTGHEYDEIFPVWNWRQIPGTTAEQNDAPLTWTKKNSTPQTTFVGAASNGASAAAAMDFHRDTLQATKAWFYCNDTLVCLGADITSSANDPVVTTINQCLLTGSITIHRDGELSTSTETKDVKDVDWVEQGGLRYIFPQQQSLTIETAPKTGNWKSVFQTASTPKPNVTKKIFSLTLNHGSAPKSATYAYYILPASAKEPTIKILSNTPQLQVVQIDNAYTAAIFWSPGTTILNDQTVAVDHPSIVLETISPTGMQLTLADPTQKLKQIIIKIGDQSKQLSLPQGENAGKSLTFSIP